MVSSLSMIRCLDVVVVLLCVQEAIVAGTGEHCGADCRPEMKAAALLQVKHQVQESPSLDMQELERSRYVGALQQHDAKSLAAAIQQVVESLGGVVVDPAGLANFSSARSDKQVFGIQPYADSFDILLQELREVGRRKDGWLALAPPEKGPMLWKMIRPDPWNCNLIEEADPRSKMCTLEDGAAELDPETFDCMSYGCNIEQGNAFRTLFKIGALPCCPTPPFCAAPACAKDVSIPPQSCRKRSSEDDLAYLKEPEVWPAYHGWGGALELDTLKLIDALGCSGKHCAAPFDLMIDLGANTGYVTEKLAVRHFAKNYIMVEANPETTGILQRRWGNPEWKNAWFAEQAPREGPAPEFEVINKALSNHSTGNVDMCLTEDSFKEETKGGCQVPIASIDDLFSGALPDSMLTPAFQEHFKQAQSAFIKVDTEGMDELVLRGMSGVLGETRGEYADGSPRYLVNFFMFEFSPWLTHIAKQREGFQDYDIKTVTTFVESIGFETFLIGPRYLPLSHGSWDDEYFRFTNDSANNAGAKVNYPNFDGRLCPDCATKGHETFTGDVFAIRSSHPQATELKIALGACQESKDFNVKDPQYNFGSDK